MSHKIRLDIANGMSQLGINVQPQDNISTAIFMVLCCALAFLSYVFVRWGLLALLRSAIKRSQATWGHVMVRHKVFEKLSLTIPAMVLNIVIPLVLDKHAILSSFIDRTLSLWLIIVLVRSTYAFLDATNDMADINQISRNLPRKALFSYQS